MLAAAGTTLAAADAVIAGEVAVGYALVRPPGHHAGPAVTDGYCFFNNVALAARAVPGRRGGPRRDRRLGCPSRERHAGVLLRA
jgi:acetoin utilization deacetylase AcuC-like enzyme